MGRTIHFRVTNMDINSISDNDIEAFWMVSDSLNEGTFREIWTCESFYFDPLAYYPNWAIEEISLDLVHNREQELTEAGYSRLNARRKMFAEGCILFHVQNDGIIRGFTKVGGNELNAALVFYGLVMLSANTGAEIAVNDEGEFLLAPLLIRGGQVKVDEAEARQSWAYWEDKGFFEDNAFRTADKKREQEDLIVTHPDFTDPAFFCRVINPKDFLQHPEYGATQIMAGFNGEYWGLNTEDPIKQSLEICSRIQKAAAEAGYEIEVAPTLKK